MGSINWAKQNGTKIYMNIANRQKRDKDYSTRGNIML